MTHPHPETVVLETRSNTTAQAVVMSASSYICQWKNNPTLVNVLIDQPESLDDIPHFINRNTQQGECPFPFYGRRKVPHKIHTHSEHSLIVFSDGSAILTWHPQGKNLRTKNIPVWTASTLLRVKTTSHATEQADLPTTGLNLLLNATEEEHRADHAFCPRQTQQECNGEAVWFVQCLMKAFDTHPLRTSEWFYTPNHIMLSQGNAPQGKITPPIFFPNTSTRGYGKEKHKQIKTLDRHLAKAFKKHNGMLFRREGVKPFDALSAHDARGRLQIHTFVDVHSHQTQTLSAHQKAFIHRDVLDIVHTHLNTIQANNPRF